VIASGLSIPKHVETDSIFFVVRLPLSRSWHRSYSKCCCILAAGDRFANRSSSCEQDDIVVWKTGKQAVDFESPSRGVTSGGTGSGKIEKTEPGLGPDVRIGL